MATGRKTGGRKKGSINKATADLRLIAQQHTEAAVRALVKSLGDPMQCVQAAKILLAYGHGAPRAAVDVSVKPVYVMSAKPLTPEEWAAKYADASGDSTVTVEPVAKPKSPRPSVGAARRPAKRTR